MSATNKNEIMWQLYKAETTVTDLVGV